MLTRLRFALLTDVTVAVVALVYFRVGEAHLFDLVGSGPASGIVGQLQAVVPITLALWLLFANGWLIYGVAQRERARTIQGVQRRR